MSNKKRRLSQTQQTQQIPPETQAEGQAQPFLWRDPYAWLTLLLALPVVSPLLQPGYHWGAHDARHALYFLFQFDKAIQDGVWYPRWAPDFAFGYGYPFFNIYGPLPSYAGEFLHALLGFSFVDTVKILLGLSAILSGLTMVWFARKLLGGAGGAIAALVYVYIPYHLFDLYVRAALAESMAFIFVPLVLWAFYQAVVAPSVRSTIAGAIAYAALMFTSNLHAFLFIPILGCYVLLLLLFTPPGQSWRGLNLPRFGEQPLFTFLWRGIPPGLVLVLGMALSAIFVLPAVTETQYVRVDQWTDGRYAFGSDFVEFFQLFSPRWGFGPSIAGPDDETGFQIGLLPLILFAFSFWLVPRLTDKLLRLTFRFWQGVVIVIAFLTLPWSRPVWEVVGFIQIAQFPWRLLFMLAPAIALVAGTIALPQRDDPELTNSPDRPQTAQQRTLGRLLPILCLILLASFPYLQAEIRDPKPTEGPVSLAALFRFQQSSDELTGSTIWVEEIPTWSPLADVVVAGGEIASRVVQTEVRADDGETVLLGVHSFQQDSVHEFLWIYAADDEQAVTFYIPYYPGWTATLYEDTAPDRPDLFPDGRIGPVITTLPIETTSPEGWMVIPVPAGEHFLELRFEDTLVRVLGKWISILMVIGLGVALVVFGQEKGG